MLLERPGEVVTREELHARLWSADTFVDFDNGLNSAIRRLRDALGDSAENSRFVETVERRGYRFIVQVDGGSAAASRIGIATVPESAKPPVVWPRIAIACVSVALLAVLVWAPWRDKAQRAEVSELQLTANSAENSVRSMAISPDGKQLAYADSTGLFLKVIRSGEVNRVLLPPDFAASVDDWFPDGAVLWSLARKDRERRACGVSRCSEARRASCWTTRLADRCPPMDRTFRFTAVMSPISVCGVAKYGSCAPTGQS